MKQNIFISGASGVGKTTVIQTLLEQSLVVAGPKTYKLVQPEDRLTLRGMINTYGFAVPSMVAKPSVRKEDDPNLFMRQLVYWQFCQLSMHQQNMVAPTNTRDIRVHDRSALDSLAYFLYDVLNFARPQAPSSFPGNEVGAQATVCDFLSTAFTETARDQIESLFASARRIKEGVGLEKSTYFAAVKDNVFRSLCAGLTKDNRTDLADEVTTSVAFILVSYARLILTVPGKHIILQQNPHTRPDEDGVRSVDEVLMSDLQSLFVTLANYVPDAMLETRDPSLRKPDVEGDLQQRVQVILREVKGE